jgi:hypothetical protein
MFRSARLIALVATALLLPGATANAQGLLAPSADTPSKPGRAARPMAAAACVGPVLSVACGVGGDALGAVGGAVTDAIGAGAGAVGGMAMDGLSSWVGEGAAWLIGKIAGLVERSTRPELDAAWFTQQYRGMLSLALLLTLGFLVIALAHAALRQDVAAAVRAAFIALPLAVCACFAAITLVELALVATDSAARVLTAGTSDDTREFFSDIGGVMVAPTPVPGFLALLAGVIAALLCLMVWMELILREAAIYLAVGFLPLSLAAMVWQRTAHLSRKLVEGLAAIILSKLTIAGAVAFAASAMGHARGDAGGMTALLAGCAVLFLAALSPWALMRLVPLAGEQLGLHRGAVRQAGMSIPGAVTALTVVRTGMRASFAAPAGPAVAAAAAAAPAQQWRPSAPDTARGLPLVAEMPAARTKPEAPARTGGHDGA